MCGKVRARKNWQATVSPEEALVEGESVTLRVMDDVPVIVFDGGRRFVVPMRWGFPDPKDWRRPRPIHARAETIDTLPAFAAAFRDGQRGILLVESFNEAPESGVQHTVTTGPAGIAMLWRRFELTREGGGGTLLACVMVTVPANALLARLPTHRMPALLAPEDWAAWLGETDTSPRAAKTCLRTVENARWTMTPEERARTAKRARPFVSDPPGLL
jgi:putative SOS response-associated peptidase YedK